MKKRKWWLSTLAAAVLIIIGIGGKQYMDKKAIEKDYQQGIGLIQKYVSNYLVENYEGIEKIEWQGVGVEWRNAKGYGPSLLGNYVNTRVNIFVSEDKYFSVRFTLTDETDYDNNLKKYVKASSLNSENIDFSIKSDLENATYDLKQSEKESFTKLEKSIFGSDNAKIIYNLEIYELNY